MTPLERVARAICEQAGLKPDDEITLALPYQSEALRGGIYVKGHRPFRPAWRFFVPHAYAAIEGMREPSEGMSEAVAEALLNRGLDVMVNGSDATLVLKAAVAAALMESPDAAPPDPDPA